jgi:hypothetical protein
VGTRSSRYNCSNREQQGKEEWMILIHIYSYWVAYNLPDVQNQGKDMVVVYHSDHMMHQNLQILLALQIWMQTDLLQGLQ